MLMLPIGKSFPRTEIEITENDRNSDDIQAINHRRQWTIEQLSALIRNNNVPKSDEWVQSVLDYLIVHGLFLVDKKSSKNSVSAVRTPLHTSNRPLTLLSGSVCRKTTVFRRAARALSKMCSELRE